MAENDVLEIFIGESKEQLGIIEAALLELEKEPTGRLDQNIVNELFRMAHSLKGGAGFFSFLKVRDLTHAMESVFGLVRDKGLVLSPAAINTLLRCVDLIRVFVEAPAAENEPETVDLMGELREILDAPPAIPCVPASAEPSMEGTAQGSPTQAPGRGDETVSAPSADTSIRVNLQTLDRLMTLAGELVLTRNQLLQCITTGDLQLIESAAQGIDIITSEMQDAVMSTRMQSIGIAFSRFHRIVRDLSQSLGKKVKLVLEGEDVELDRTIIEAMNAPMTHLVRNALDHGIESPEVRERHGKPTEGTLRMSASHKAGQVIIEISDDGQGLDLERIRDKALAMGIVRAEEMSSMTEDQLTRLIFRPGFSTKDQVSEFSGRGVGIDVVQTNIAKLGGVTDVISRKGQGTTFRIKLPLTLAIIPSLLVAVAGERYAIPQVNLVELVRIPPSEIKHRMERIGSATVMRLRSELLPIVRLREVLGAAHSGSETIPSDSPAELAPESSGDACNIVVVAAGDFQYGIVVDTMLDSAEIVVKPLGSDLGSCKIYAGATILGDGHVALILDVVGIANWLQVSDLHQLEEKRRQARELEFRSASDFQTLLVFENGSDEYFAIPLVNIERIERFHSQQLIQVGEKRGVKHRGVTMAILAVDDLVPVKPCPVNDKLYFLALKMGGREFGLLASNLVDIMETDAVIDDVSYRQAGIIGSIMIGDRLILIVDPFEIGARQYPELLEQIQRRRVTEKTALVVDDSAFFRRQVSTFLGVAGFEVINASDGHEAWEILEKGDERIDIVVTDIEMPGLDGFGLTQKIRSSENCKNLPVVAVTSCISDESISHGFELGVTSYLPKLNREQLVETCKAVVMGMDSVASFRPRQPNRLTGGDEFEFVVFDVGGVLCGIDIEFVHEINRVLNIIPVHHASDHVKGVVNLRGEIVTVIDMRKKLEMKRVQVSKSMRLILVKRQGERIGLLVDGVDDIVNAKREEVIPPPSHLDKELRKHVNGVYRMHDSLVALLDIERVLAPDLLN